MCTVEKSNYRPAFLFRVELGLGWLHFVLTIKKAL
jgi:hypothetical protein